MSSDSNAANVGGSAGDAIKKGFAKIHGAGEAIRGNINTFADSATNTDSRKSEAVTARGIDELSTGHYHGTGAGVTPHDTARERLNRDMQGEHGGVGTGLAAEANRTGTTHTGTGGMSTNYGPHSTNLGNKLDPTVDSDASTHPDARRL